jgi:sugar/nucleoside kinase (ribokinase family)
VRLPLKLPPADSRPFDVVGLGQNSVDLLAVIPEHPEPDSHVRVERLIRLPGGEVATALVACARLRCRSRYLGTIGTDEAGGLVEARLREEGIDLEYVRRVEAPNRFAFILVDHTGHRTVIWHRDPRLDTLAETLDPSAVASGRVLLLDASDCNASLVAARAARKAGVPVVLDIDAFDSGVERLLRSVDVVIASRSFFAHYGDIGIGTALRRLAAEFRPALAVVTLGEEGSLAICGGAGGGEIRTPAFTVPVVDSTGAGDAFRGGFVASWVRFGAEVSTPELLRYASAVAGLNCGALGAQTGLPVWSEVDVLVTAQPYERSKY